MSELDKRIKSLFYLRLSTLICIPLQNLGIIKWSNPPLLKDG